MPDTSFISNCLYTCKKSVSAISGGVLCAGLAIAGELFYSVTTDTSAKDNIENTWYILVIAGLAGASAGWCWASRKAAQEPLFDVELADPMYQPVKTDDTEKEDRQNRQQFGFGKR